MKYRREIDGLRAVAVLPVILFHAGFQIFSGGYVGVDVFFVISGYLITTILVEDLERGDFSLLRFYERRARRILPALFFVILCCLPFAWVWLYGSRMQDFAQSVVAVSLFASNILFWRESGYFGAAAEEKPLLHTWSLAVEEQYYLLFPVLLAILWRYGRERVFWSLVLISAISFTLSEWGWRKWPDANFYLSPTRAWELFAGSIAALIVHSRGVRKNGFVSLLGLSAIVFSIFVFDETTPFPSVFTLLPVLGVVALLLCAESNSLAAKMLSNRPFVGVGLISYSAYLWHQPLFAFARVRSVGEPDPMLMAMLAVLSLLLAAFSWKYVEQPFRSGKNSVVRRRSAVFGLSIAGLVAFGLFGIAGHVTQGFEGRLSESQKDILAWEEYPRGIHYREGDCFLKRDQNYDDFAEACTGTGRIVVWGDSHAAALSSGWILLDPSISQFTASSCPPLIGYQTSARPDCAQINLHVLELIRQQKPSTVYLHANWPGAGNALPLLAATVSALRDAGVNDVVILGAVPAFAPSLPLNILTQIGALEAGARLHANLVPAQETDAALAQLASDAEVGFVSAAESLCENSFCDVVANGVSGGLAPMAWDNVHLTRSGAVHLLKKLQAEHPDL